MPVLDAISLNKSLGTRTLLRNVHFTVVRGEKVGLVGDNGSGKSTLGKILAGRLEADSGTVTTRKGAKISYLSQDPHLEAGKNARETALSGLTEWHEAHRRHETLCKLLGQTKNEQETARILEEQAEVTHRIERLGGWNREDEARRILTQLKMTDLTQDVGTMSGGERRRVALARLLIEAPDLAILDEPTNHLDADTIEWLEEYLTNTFTGAVLLITHDRYLLNNVVTRTLEIEDGEIHSYEGGWEEFLIGREDRKAHAERAESNRQNFLRKEIEWLRRQPKARSGKQKARIGRAEQALSVAAPKRVESLELKLEDTRLGGNVLEARGLKVGIGGKVLMDGLDFHLTKGQRVGIVGRSGAGKTTLLRTLLGEHPPLGGEVIRGKNTSVAYLDQMRSGVTESETVYDSVTGGRPSVTVGETEYSSYSYLKRFRFEGDVLRQKVEGLSGGERSRLALARLLLSTANVLVLDEPTNDLDVMTLSALEELVLGLKGAALIVSHDRYFLDRVATSVLALDGEGGVDHIQGGYSEYAAERAQKRKKAPKSSDTRAQEKAPAAPPSLGSAPPAKKKLTYAEELELKSLFEKVEAKTTQVSELEAKLADPSLYSERRAEAARYEEELRAAREDLETLELRWLELEERRAG
jgi:ATP-binding cassette subfamily F protein uup